MINRQLLLLGILRFFPLLFLIVFVCFLQNDAYYIVDPVLLRLTLLVTFLYLLSFSQSPCAPQLFFVTLSLVVIAIVTAYDLEKKHAILVAASMLCGFLIAVMLMLLRYVFYKIELKWRLYFYVAALEKVLLLCFDCYLKPDYPKFFYVYERRLYDAKNIAMLRSANIARYLNAAPFKYSTAMKKFIFYKLKCDDILLMLFDAGQLRYRVGDHATFRFCSNEFNQIRLFLNNELNVFKGAILKNAILSKQQETQSLDELEGIYELVLQVVAKEPVSFLLFIHEMRRLSICILNSRQ